MTPLIISFIALVISIIALIKAFWKEKPIELKINDDLSGIKDIDIECKGIKIK